MWQSSFKWCILGVFLAMLSCSKGHSAPDSEVVSVESVVFTTQIRKPIGPPSVLTDLVDMHGRSVTVACNTCHATRSPNRDAQLGQNLAAFHQKLNGAHGKLSCVACHNADDGYASLRLADGKSLAYSEVMQLCAQCHGPQFRDYQHGAHGGMNGYWDLSRGERTRNNCIDCHHPHAPKFRTFMPAPGPHDQSHAGRPGHE